MAITGAHALIYTAEPEALRDLLKDVLEFKHVGARDASHPTAI